MTSCANDKTSCCCSAKTAGARAAADLYSGRVFHIEGLDCVEEINILKDQIGPLVGGGDKLAFDVINGRMRILPEAKQIADHSVIKAVAATGMKASRWQPGREPPANKTRQRTYAFYTGISGLCIVVGIIIHISSVGELSGMQIVPPHQGAIPWEAIGRNLSRLVKANLQQPMSLSEQGAYVLAVIFGLRHVIGKALYALRRLRPDMHLLMTVAVAGAMLINQWFEAATVCFLFSLSLALESWSIGRARHAVQALLDLAPATVTVKDEQGRDRIVSANEISIGTPFIVMPGNKIPLDGEVLSGFSSVNQAPITGESFPIIKQCGDQVFAGTINGEAALEIKSTKLATDTALAHIIRLVEDAHSNKAQAEQWVEKFARIYTPAVMLLALAVCLIPPLLLQEAWQQWFYRALVLLVIACPCALVISTPVSIVAALASAARHGILIKGGVYIEAPARLVAIAFDKTGTLTSGEAVVTGVYPVNGYSEDALLSRAAALEARSHHPLAKAILQHAAQRGIAMAAAEQVTVFPGLGVSGQFQGIGFWLGSRRYLQQQCGSAGEQTDAQAAVLERNGQTVIAVGNEQQVCGLIAIADRPRAQIKPVLQALRDTGIKHLTVLTGDNLATANNIAGQVGINSVHAELLPADKVAIVGDLVDRYGHVAMVGDGINDAPALARADLGIAMGAMGSDAAIEAADIALMSDDLAKLPWLIRHSKNTLRIIRQNIVFALAVKATFAVLAFAGMATLWEAIIADVGASLLVVANGLRLLNRRGQ